ncbi:carbohydrate-binding module family 1 [Fusarium albosuccineum]|uniref:Carbohydrate-binding module family 1 n=2 Tax=Fusarium decemcellulare species complex TaxID=1329916 RepID=A0A8H4LQ83_9HYPO|nr:carbohydrate-binding module family 1 [Fusarium albosuccineum]
MLLQTALLALSMVTPSLAQVRENFESGWDKVAWPTYAPDCDQGGKVTLDSTTKARSGKNSIRVDGASGYCGHKFFGTTAVPEGDVYVRAWVKASKALTDAHVTFITMPDEAQAAGKHLRVGGQSKILMYNHESDDATLPDLSPQGIAASTTLKANTWQCIEHHLGTDGTLETWVGGKAVKGLTSKPKAASDFDGQWQNGAIKPKISAVYFGWESYGGDTNTMWYDDIVVDSSRIGCYAKSK